jgi:hypothetical protein
MNDIEMFQQLEAQALAEARKREGRLAEVDEEIARLERDRAREIRREQLRQDYIARARKNGRLLSVERLEEAMEKYVEQVLAEEDARG